MKKFKDKVVVITGAGAGIGKATAIKFGQEGAKLALWDINDSEGKQLEKELLEKGIEAKFYRVNVANANEVEDAVFSVSAKFGTIDILINNAGITKDATLQKLSLDDWNRVIEVNLNGVFYCTKYISPIMIQNGFGRILNASSIVGLYGNFGQTNYVASKSGIIGLTKTWSRELGKHGITVNAIAPGFIQTEMVEKMPKEVIEAAVEKIPVRRIGLPEDVANAYLFLASSEASFINGAVLSVDGGLIN